MKICGCIIDRGFNCDGICYGCGRFVGDERYDKFWEDEERSWRQNDTT